jgi:hypothetical protein
VGSSGRFCCQYGGRTRRPHRDAVAGCSRPLAQGHRARCRGLAEGDEGAKNRRRQAPPGRPRALGQIRERTATAFVAAGAIRATGRHAAAASSASADTRNQQCAIQSSAIRRRVVRPSCTLDRGAERAGRQACGSAAFATAGSTCRDSGTWTGTWNCVWACSGTRIRAVINSSCKAGVVRDGAAGIRSAAAGITATQSGDSRAAGSATSSGASRVGSFRRNAAACHSVSRAGREGDRCAHRCTDRCTSFRAAAVSRRGATAAVRAARPEAGAQNHRHPALETENRESGTPPSRSQVRRIARHQIIGVRPTRQ